MLSSNENIIQIVREASVFIMEVWGLIMACDVHTPLFCSLIKEVKTKFARGPGRGDTCHLSNLDETLSD